MPRLEVYQSLWAMDGLPGVDLDGDPEGVTRRILDAGFDGMGVNLARRPRAARAAAVVAAHGKSWEAQAFVRTPDELARYIDEAVAIGGAHHLNVQIAPGPVGRDEAVAVMRAMLAAARGAPLPVFFETHRGRLMNDLLLTAAVVEACPDLRLTGDLSHFATAHEMVLPPAPPYAAAMETLIGRCDALHLRIAGEHQVQVAVDAAPHAAWRAQFEAWWRAAMDAWLARAAAGARFAVLCELGPPPYAIVDLEGRELTDRWAEALVLRDLARRLFAEASAAATARAAPGP